MLTGSALGQTEKKIKRTIIGHESNARVIRLSNGHLNFKRESFLTTITHTTRVITQKMMLNFVEKAEYKYFKPQVIPLENIETKKEGLIIDLEEEVKVSDLDIDFTNTKCAFSVDDSFKTSTDAVNWVPQKKDLDGPLFALTGIDNNQKRYYYLIDGRLVRYIKITTDNNAGCVDPSISYIGVNQLNNE